MKYSIALRRLPLLIASLLPIIPLTGCAVVNLDSKATARPHVFISYAHQSPPEGDAGLRLAVKDLIDVKGLVTSAGSEHFYKNSEPATKDAACMKIARQRGVTIVGKTNLSEFAIGVSGENDYFGTPVNPIRRKRIPGGSSSGSAVAVALDLADVALGTDSAGSIRVPAACCGIAGLKTTKGLISLEGVFPLSPTYLDTVGPMGADIHSLVIGMGLLQAGFEKEYAAAKAAHPTADTIRIGRLYVSGTHPAIDRAIDKKLAEKGFQVLRLDERFVNAWQQAEKEGTQVAAAATWYTDAKHTRQLGVSLRSRETILYGELVFKTNYGSDAAIRRAYGRREEWRNELKRVLEKVDAIALPVMKTPPPKLTMLQGIFEKGLLDIQTTVSANYAGNPALAVPVPLKGAGFPVTSIQLIGPNLSEARLLNIGRLIETE
jgi:amidase